jgi:hypothetical protein
MKLNVNKTKIMVIGSEDRDITITFNGENWMVFLLRISSSLNLIQIISVTLIKINM